MLFKGSSDTDNKIVLFSHFFNLEKLIFLNIYIHFFVNELQYRSYVTFSIHVLVDYSKQFPL